MKKEKITLVVMVDMQVDFATGVLGSDRAKIAVEKAATFLEKVKNKNCYLLCTLDTHYENYMETREGKNLPIIHCVKGTKGHELENCLKPFVENKDKCFIGTKMIEKITFGAYDISIPDEIIEYVDEIVIFGLGNSAVQSVADQRKAYVHQGADKIAVKAVKDAQNRENQTAVC